MAPKSRKTATITACILAAASVMLWIGGMRDAPVDYSKSVPRMLKQRIGKMEAEMASGKSHAALDADRYWPYDRDRTVLAMLQFREGNGRWPRDLNELAQSGLVPDISCIHKNWRLDVNGADWELHVEGWGKIAFFKEMDRESHEPTANGSD